MTHALVYFTMAVGVECRFIVYNIHLSLFVVCSNFVIPNNVPVSTPAVPVTSYPAVNHVCVGVRQNIFIIKW